MLDLRHLAPPDFVAHGVGHAAWTHATTPALAGLERWGTELAARERRIGIAALVAAARAVFPGAVAAAGLAAILNGPDGDPQGGGYYEWPWTTCVGRGLVVAARAAGDVEPLVQAWRAAAG